MIAAWTKLMPADLQSLSACMQEVEAFLAGYGIPQEAVFATNLALEELVTNTIKYGYGSEAPRAIEVSLSLETQELSLLVIDDAHAFDPFSQPDPDFTLPAEKRPIGGLGIHLIRNMMSTCLYQREKNKNIVLLTKTWD